MSDERFDRIERKLDSIESKAEDVRVTIAQINATLASQHVSLTDHIKRTELLEKAIVPVQARMSQATGVFKFVVLLGILAAIAEGATAVLELMKGR